MEFPKEKTKVEDLREHLLTGHELHPKIADVIERMNLLDLSIFHSEIHLQEEIYLHD